jgi:hypothetical protein
MPAAALAFNTKKHKQNFDSRCYAVLHCANVANTSSRSTVLHCTLLPLQTWLGVVVASFTQPAYLPACNTNLLCSFCITFLLLQRSAAVVFESAEDVSHALLHASSGQVVDFLLPVPEGPVGLKAWLAQHKAQRPGNTVLQQQVGLQLYAAQATRMAVDVLANHTQLQEVG